MSTQLTIKPIAGFKALDGCHCVTSSFKKMCAFNGYDISEEMLFGLGAGLGFMYWHQRGSLPFLGGRGRNDFNQDLSQRTGIQIIGHTTTSRKKAESELLRLLDSGQPVCVYADMAYLSYLALPPDAHFGGHLIVIAGYDAASKQVLIADFAPQMTGIKTGRFYALPLKQLSEARDSKYPPFPPKNQWFMFDFAKAKPPDRAKICAAIDQNARAMLHPPIKNFGVAGIHTAVAKIRQWPQQFDDQTLRAALFNVYVYTEIGGTGGGLFRYMYSRFLAEAAEITGSPQLKEASEGLRTCADLWRELAQPLDKAFELDDPCAMLSGLIRQLEQVAQLEEEVWQKLKQQDSEMHKSKRS